MNRPRPTQINMEVWFSMAPNDLRLLGGTLLVLLRGISFSIFPAWDSWVTLQDPGYTNGYLSQEERKALERITIEATLIVWGVGGRERFCTSRISRDK